MSSALQKFLAIALCFLVVPGTQVSAAQTCMDPRPGPVSWWPMDGSVDDIADGNIPSMECDLSFVAAKVGSGVSFGEVGFIDIPHAENLANQEFTIDAWVRPDGPGPTNDPFGSVIVSKAITATDASAVLLWRATDSKFLFLFGNISSELVISTNQFNAGQFYHVAATYDGTTFKLYVDGSLQGEFTSSMTIAYDPSFTWTIGNNPSQFRPPAFNFPRTWNGVIDEVDIFNRALADSEIQAIVIAGSAGKCRGSATVEIDIKPNSDPNEINLCSNGAMPVAILGSPTLDVSDVDSGSLSFAKAVVKLVGGKNPQQLCSYEDINGDFIDDLVCHFVTTDIEGIDRESTTATLNGELIDGTLIEATDSVYIVKDTCN